MARNTQELISLAMKRLMMKKPLDSITVKELADEANINKKTFYYHYHGISDLLNWMYASFIEQLIDKEGVTAYNWPDHLKRISSAIRADRDYISAIYASNYAPEFRQAMSRVFDKALDKYVKSSMKQWEFEHGKPLALTGTDMEYLVSYHSMALFGMVERWFRRGMRETDDEFTELIKILSNESLWRSFSLMSSI